MSLSSAAPDRRPDGVFLDPDVARPSPVNRAQALGVVALREPVTPGAVAHLVFSVAEAWQRSSLDELTGLLTADAEPLDGSARGRASLTEGFRQRLQAHEYNRLAGVALVRQERIARWDYDDLGDRGAPARPLTMHPGEVYVRVPVEVTHAGGEKLFGEQIVMLLRTERGKLRIAAYGETE
jgi:hypothetical protein